jgi:hypothetical protein
MNIKKLPMVLLMVVTVLFLVVCDPNNDKDEKENGNGDTVYIAPISGKDFLLKGQGSRYSTTITVTGDASRSVTWSIKETDKHAGTTIRLIGGGGILVVDKDENLNSITIVVTSNFNNRSREFTITLGPACTRDNAMIPIVTARHQIQSFWQEPVGTGRNYLIDDNGKLALGLYSANLPYSSWYLMQTADGKKALKNAATGNYINVKDVTRAITTMTMEQMLPSQPNVSPYEDDDTFYWIFNEVGTGPNHNDTDIVGTNFLNYGFTTATGGAISHEFINRTAFPSQNNPSLFHVQWRYDVGDENDVEDNALWDIRLELWGSYLFGVYRHDW